MDINLKKLDLKQDNRGILFEVLRKEDVVNKFFGQILVTTAKPGKSKGGHYHKRKSEWYCVLKGKGLLRLEDKKTGEVKELILSEKLPTIVEMPKLVFHKITNIGKKDLLLLVYVDEVYNPNDTDTFIE